jgi:V8-like Glu-specific endopeptidase
MNTLFDIVKFRKEKGRKPFTKEEIMRLADAKFKDKNDRYYKDFIESKLSNPFHQNYFFYEE